MRAGRPDRARSPGSLSVLTLLQTLRGTLGLLAALSLWIPGSLVLYLVALAFFQGLVQIIFLSQIVMTMKA